MYKRVGMLAAGIAVVIVLLLSINVLSSTALRSARVDLTENQLYTLSEGTKAVLAKIEEPVTLRLYFSKEQAADYPHIMAYYQRVEELLLEYAHHAGGKLTLETLDPEPFTETEDRAVAYGLQGAPSRSGDLLYFGLAGSNTLGDEEIIPFFDTSKEAYLEYDLSKIVHQLSNPGKITVGLLSSLPIEGGPSNPFMGQAEEPWFVVDHLRQLFEVRTLMPGAGEIPDDVGVLVVVHPKDLPEATLYAIDQFVLGGGKVIAFVDPYCEADQPPADPQNPLSAMMAPRASTLGPLFDAWGVELVAEQLAADRANALSVTWNNRGRPEPIDYVLYEQLGPEQFNTSEVASRDLGLIRLGTPGFLRPIPEAKTAMTMLVQTSAEAMQIPVSSIQFSPDPPRLLAEFAPTGTPFTLAARISGPASSAFPAGRPQGEPEEGEVAPDPLEGHRASAEEIHVVVVADADLLADQWWVRLQDFAGLRLASKTADNGDFLVNLIDQMQGSTDLISLRSRGVSAYPFEVVEELRREAEQAFRAEERELVQREDETTRRLTELQSQKDGESLLMLSPEQEAEIQRLRDDMIATRTRLREVRHDLDKDVEALGTRLKLLNIAAVPGLVLVFALGMVVLKANKRSKA